MIEYRDDAGGLEPGHLRGFFEGWPDPPSPETHLRILGGSDLVALAVEMETGEVAGFATAITDGVLAAYIPLLEVRPAHRGLGIGSDLVRRLVNRLEALYMIDVVCDESVLPFYERLGLRPARAAALRRYDRQSGSRRPDRLDDELS